MRRATLFGGLTAITLGLATAGMAGSAVAQQSGAQDQSGDWNSGYMMSLLQNSSNAANFPCVRGGGAAGAQAGAGLSCVTRSI